MLPPGVPLVGFSLGPNLSGVPEAALEVAQLPDPVPPVCLVECPVFAELLQLLALAKCAGAFGIANIAVIAITAPKAIVSLFICSQILSQYKRIL